MSNWWLTFFFLKRKAKIKDTGSFLPGHGGLLDRVDSILLGVPLGLISIIVTLDEKLISILGSTGSVGLCTLKIIEKRKNLNLLSSLLIKIIN